MPGQEIQEQKTRYAIVVDKDGYAVFIKNDEGKNVGMVYVLLMSVSVPVLDDEGNPILDENDVPQMEVKEVPYAYELREGEVCIEADVQTALPMVRPRWTGHEWIETATEEEIAAARPEPAPTVTGPSTFDILRADVDYIAMETGVILG